MPFGGGAPASLGIRCGAAWPWENSRVAAALITVGTTSLGMAQGGRVEGSMLPGTQRLAVSSLSASGSPAAHAAASDQVMPLCAISGPHLSPASAPHFLSTSYDPLDSGSTIRSYPPFAPVSPAGRPLAARIANTPPSPGNKEGFRQGLAGFRPCLCPHRALLLCCRCAKRKLVGASKARCSDRCLLPRCCRELGRRIPDRLLEEG